MSTIPSIVNKISVAKVCGRLKAPKEKIYIMQVYGVANGSEKGLSNLGEYTKLTGRFRGINMDTGAVYEAGECFLPNIALNLVLGALENNKGVEFAFNIGVYPAENAYGYEYCCDPLMEASENDPLEIMQKKLKALDAPKKVLDDSKKKVS